MELGVLIALATIAFGGGIWFHKIGTRLSSLDDKLTPLIILHKEELIKYYLERGILPNPGMSPRKRYLIDKLEANTISIIESQELSRALKSEEREARAVENNDALVAILGLIALVAVLAALSKK